VLEALRRSGVIDASYNECAPLDTAKSHRLIALGRHGTPEIVVKLDRPDVLWAAARFLQTYGASPVVPRLRYVDPDFGFFAYEYVPGADPRESTDRIDKAQALQTIVRDLLSRYVAADAADACWVDELYPPDNDTGHLGRTWQGFISMYLYHRHMAVRPHLPSDAEALVRDLAVSPERRGDTPLALLHGDCGAHNFVFRGGALTGVIDPRPVAGEPIWDLAMVFVSWPDALTLDAIAPAAEALERAGRWGPPPRERQRLLTEEVLIALYAWIGVVAKHIPKELPVYIAAWARWTDLLGRA